MQRTITSTAAMIRRVLMAGLLILSAQSASAATASTAELVKKALSGQNLGYNVLTADGSKAGRIIIRYGNILEPRGFTDAIVNAANEGLLGGGGIDGMIHKAAGQQLEIFNQKISQVNTGVRCPIGSARVSPPFKIVSGGNLAKDIAYIINTVGPMGSNSDRVRLIQGSYASSLKLAAYINQRYLAQVFEPHVDLISPQDPDIKHWADNVDKLLPSIGPLTPINSIGFPLISAGIYGYNVKDSAPYALHATITTMQDYAAKIKGLSDIKPFTVIFYFYASNPPPKNALSIYIKNLQKTLNDKGEIRYPEHLHLDLTHNLLDLSQQLSTLASQIS